VIFDHHCREVFDGLTVAFALRQIPDFHLGNAAFGRMLEEVVIRTGVRAPGDCWDGHDQTAD
jgi:hypothetical protein